MTFRGGLNHSVVSRALGFHSCEGSAVCPEQLTSSAGSKHRKQSRKALKNKGGGGQ